MARKAATVSQFNDYIDKSFRNDPILGNAYVIGQISDLTYHKSGHIYFSIMDEYSKLSCMMFKNNADLLKVKLEEGQEVIVSGYINVYKPRGTYSLVCRDIEVVGVGQASIAFNLLKEKLEKEGLFSPLHKKAIPKFPKNVAVITAETGAAIQDILKIIKSRNNYVNVLVFPSLVQGEEAAPSMIKQLDRISKDYSFVDTVIIGRGGGASDDLFPFNDELLARKIYEFEIPIISAVGHEIDFTISDFVADMRAETPTAAAQLAVPDINEIKFILDKNKLSMETSLYRLIEIEKTKIQNAKFKMDNSIANIINTFKNALDKNKLLLEENNPLQIMKKGYAVLEDEDNKLVSSLKAIDLSKDYNLRLQDGTLKIKILDKREEPCQKN